jgi:hypothetical protein
MTQTYLKVKLLRNSLDSKFIWRFKGKTEKRGVLFLFGRTYPKEKDTEFDFGNKDLRLDPEFVKSSHSN